MKDIVYYTAELKDCIHKGNANVSEQTIEEFTELLEISVDFCLEAYERHDLKSLSIFLEEQRTLRRNLTEELRNSSEQLLILSSKIVQNYNTFNKLLRDAYDARGFEEEMELIEQGYRYVRSILRYLYRHAHVQHKVSKENLEIPASTLSDSLKVLEQVGCVEKIESGKYSFYNLTVEGKKYVHDREKGIDEEYIYDPDVFMEERRNMVKNKLQCVSEKAESLGYEKNPGVSYKKRQKIFVEQVIRTGEKMGKSFCMG